MYIWSKSRNGDNVMKLTSVLLQSNHRQQYCEYIKTNIP